MSAASCLLLRTLNCTSCYTFRRRFAVRHGSVSTLSHGKPKDAHWVAWRCLTCTPRDLEAPDEKDLEDPARFDVGLLHLLTFAVRALLEVAS